MLKGKLHIDLLLPNASACNAFGVRTGTIIIKRKIKNPNYNSNSKADKVIKEAKKWVGKLSYSQARRQNFYSGGSADCSSFAHHCFKKIGIEIGGYTGEQVYAGKEVNKNKRKKGDLVFFHTCNVSRPFGATHVGICLSKKQFIHCSSARNGVCITNFSAYSPPIVRVMRVL
jgi:cell wall-associated NlpC family hydrolase